jgi:malonate transporter and related proteins
MGVQLGLFDENVGNGLSRFVFWLAFPALLLVSMAKAPAPDATMGSYIGIWLALLMATQICARLCARIIGQDRQGQAGIAMASSCANTAFLGTAVLSGLLGPSILAFVAALVAVENIIVVGLGVAGLNLAKSDKSEVSKVVQNLVKGVFNPTSVGALIGFLISISSWSLPNFIVRPLELLGGAASPAGLVALGIILAISQTNVKRDWQPTALVVFFKCLLLPVLMWLAFSAINAPPTIIVAASVLAACPSAVNVFIQARQAQIWAAPAATAVFVTTLVSIFGVSAAAAFAVMG